MLESGATEYTMSASACASVPGDSVRARVGSNMRDSNRGLCCAVQREQTRSCIGYFEPGELGMVVLIEDLSAKIKAHAASVRKRE